MKKVVSNISKVISLNSIDNDDLVIGILNQSIPLCLKGEVFIVVEIIPDTLYKFVSLETFTAYEFDGNRSVRGLLQSNQTRFEFYLLDDRKEIKEFIK